VICWRGFNDDADVFVSLAVLIFLEMVQFRFGRADPTRDLSLFVWYFGVIVVRVVVDVVVVVVDDDPVWNGERTPNISQ
jgi:hypothetical protein